SLIYANSPLWLWVTPVMSGGFLALTGGLLIWDLEHPERFYLLFTRPQWKSWLVKGGFIIFGYSIVLAVHFGVSVLIVNSIGPADNPFTAAMDRWVLGLVFLSGAGIPLAVLTAVYTGYLFAQAKARDLWQNPLLPPHLLVQAILLGSAVIMISVTAYKGTLQSDVLLFLDTVRPEIYLGKYLLLLMSILHLLLICGELSLTHGTAHTRVAAWEMTRGRYRRHFWIGVLLSFAAVLVMLLPLPWLGINTLVYAASIPALIGMMLYEHAYVQAGRSGPPRWRWKHRT